MDVFVARQPIFDREQNVFAYELLFRSGLDRTSFEHMDGDTATSSVITDSFFTIGMESLTGGKRAFVNFTKNLLLNETATLLPKELLTVEILENVEPEEKVIKACKKLKEAGYLLALDDFVFEPKFQPLIDLADIIKVDFVVSDEEERKALIERVDTKRIKLLAEKVETQEEFEKSLELGYSYFQGYFFSKPATIVTKDIPGFKINNLQILYEVNQSDLDFDQIEEIIKRDVNLSYKLMKFINSSVFGFQKEIQSIKHALVLLGIGELKKWVSLITLRSMGEDKPEELAVNSVLRAKFCELLAPMVGMNSRKSDLFLLGMFSNIDAFIDRPKSDIFSELPISEDVKGALLEEKNDLRDVFEVVQSYEKGDWKTFSELSEKFKLDEKKIPELYHHTLEWTNQIFRN